MPDTAEDYASWIVANKDKKGTPEFETVATAYQQALDAEGAAVAPSVVPAPTEDVGFFGGIKETFTGERRTTDEIERMPTWQKMPEFQSWSTVFPEQAKVAVGTMMARPEEMANVIKEQFPDITTRVDEMGNQILRSSVNGQEYAIKPGFETSDIPRALSSGALFSLLKGRGLIRSGAEGAGLQASYEGLQTLLGGDFGTTDVGLAGAAPPTLKALGFALKLGYSNTIGRLLNKNNPPANVTSLPILSDQELVDVARRAAQNDKEAIRLMAEMAAPDEKVLAAAQRLGIEDFLQPDHYTTDQGFRELSQIAKSVKPSAVGAAETAGLQKVGQRALDLIEELGGTTDLSRINQQVRQTMRTTLDELNPAETIQWTNLRKGVGEANRFNPSKIIAHLEERIQKVGGDVNDLSNLEQYVYNKLMPREVYGKVGGQKVLVSIDDPTYTLIDDVRRTVGKAARSQGELGANADTGMAKLLYGILDSDVAAIAANAGQKELYDLAKATTRTIVGLENDMISLFGKQLSMSMVDNINNSISQLAKGDADTIVRLIGNIPEEMRERVVTSGLIGAFGKATADGALNFNSYKLWFEGLLRNRVAMDTVFKYLPEGGRRQLFDLYRVSKAVKLSTDQRVRTGRPIQKGLEEGDRLLARLYEVGRRTAIGIPIEAAGATVGLSGLGLTAGITSAIVGGRGMKETTTAALDKLIASTQFVNAVKQAGTAQEQQTVRALAASKPFVQFMESVNLPPSSAEQFILSAFQSARAAAGEQEFPVEEPDAPAAPPQARVMPSAPPTRGVPGLGTGQPAPAAPAVAQGPVNSQSREMLQQLFPEERLA
jgi:hypothetical protein